MAEEQIIIEMVQVKKNVPEDLLVLIMKDY